VKKEVAERWKRGAEGAETNAEAFGAFCGR